MPLQNRFTRQLSFSVFSMDGGELFNRIQDRGNHAFTERGKRAVILQESCSTILIAHLYLLMIIANSLNKVPGFWGPQTLLGYIAVKYMLSVTFKTDLMT